MKENQRSCIAFLILSLKYLIKKVTFQLVCLLDIAKDPHDGDKGTLIKNNLEYTKRRKDNFSYEMLICCFLFYIYYVPCKTIYE